MPLTGSLWTVGFVQQTGSLRPAAPQLVRTWALCLPLPRPRPDLQGTLKLELPRSQCSLLFTSIRPSRAQVAEATRNRLASCCAAAFPVLLPLAVSSLVPVTLSLKGFQVSDVEIRKKREMVGDTVRINAPAFLSFFSRSLFTLFI